MKVCPRSLALSTLSHLGATPGAGERRLRIRRSAYDIVSGFVLMAALLARVTQIDFCCTIGKFEYSAV